MRRDAAIKEDCGAARGAGRPRRPTHTLTDAQEESRQKQWATIPVRIVSGMITPAVAIALLWVAFVSYWLIAALGVKKPVREAVWWQRFGFRAVIFVVVLLSFRVEKIRGFVLASPAQHSMALQAAGIALCVCGLAFAVWARLHLGRNWGQPMSLKEGHELVTTGPYAHVRHPIYSGILLAMAGSGLVVGAPWPAALLVALLYFVFSARTEEKIMAQQFPEQYPEYKGKTKALVPFVW